MIEAKRYLKTVLDTDLSQDVLLVATQAGAPALEEGDVTFSISLIRKRPLPGELYFDQDEPLERKLFCRLRFYSEGILRILISTTERDFVQESPMLDWSPDLETMPAQLEEDVSHWRAYPEMGGAFFELESGGRFEPVLSPDGALQLRFQANDHFVPNLWDSFPLILLERADRSTWLGLSLHIPPC